jgi:hypothetical protein
MSMPRTTSTRLQRPEPAFRETPVAALAFVVALLIAACGGNGSGSGLPGARYVVHASTDTPDGRLNYFVPVESLADGMLDLSRGLEVPGVARLYAPRTGGYFSFGSSTDLTITRYDLANGQLAQTGVVSMQNQGVTSLQRTMAFISETKAYYLDERNARIVIWDPQGLAITGSIELAMVARADMDTKFVRQNYPVRPGRLITTVRWTSPAGDTLARETGLLIIDTDGDTVAHYEVDARCAGAVEVVELPSGDVYFANGPDEITGDALRGSSDRHGCMLRVKAGEERFDAAYLVKLSDLVGGRVACNILPLSSPDTVLFRVLDEAKGAWTPENDVIGDTEAWDWWRLNVQTGTASATSDLATTTVYTNYTIVGEQVLLTGETGAASSQFIELLPDGGVRPGLEAPGFLWAATELGKEVE